MKDSIETINVLTANITDVLTQADISEVSCHTILGKVSNILRGKFTAEKEAKRSGPYSPSPIQILEQRSRIYQAMADLEAAKESDDSKAVIISDELHASIREYCLRSQRSEGRPLTDREVQRRPSLR